MNCRDCTSMLSAHRDGRLDEAQRTSVDQHLGTCDSCRRAARMMRVTGEVMAAQGPAEPSSDLAARAARAALTADADEATSPLWRWWVRVAAPATTLGAAAALVLVLIGGTPKAQPGDGVDADPIAMIGDGVDGDLDSSMLPLGDE